VVGAFSPSASTPVSSFPGRGERHGSTTSSIISILPLAGGQRPVFARLADDRTDPVLLD
jgi:hypothetical protein